MDSLSRRSVFGPREFGLLMIGIGLVALTLGTYEHRRDMRDLRREYARVPMRSSSRVLAGLIAILGIAAFMEMIFR